MTIKTFIAATSFAALSATAAIAGQATDLSVSTAIEALEDNKAPNTLRTDNGEPADVVGTEMETAAEEALEDNKAPQGSDAGGDVIVDAGDGESHDATGARDGDLDGFDG